MRRALTILSIFLVTAIFLTNTSVLAAVSVQASPFDFSDVQNGKVTVSYTSSSIKHIKLLIQKDDRKYFYDISSDGSSDSFTLQMGPGKYTFSILENTTENTYRFVVKKTFYVSEISEISTFLNSVQNIYWNNDMKAVIKAGELTKDKKTAIEKVRSVYNYIIENIRYDRTKLSNVSSGYIPDIENTFETKTGICYDYSALFAAMLRSQGIPAKLVTGHSPYVSGYHAWNEVYLEETNEWVMIDTTVDAAMKDLENIQMIKPLGDFTIRYIY
jgi:transglutaminase-like putative cysteine protease